jgi:hypothetical protein
MPMPSYGRIPIRNTIRHRRMSSAYHQPYGTLLVLFIIVIHGWIDKNLAKSHFQFTKRLPVLQEDFVLNF